MSEVIEINNAEEMIIALMSYSGVMGDSMVPYLPMSESTYRKTVGSLIQKGVVKKKAYEGKKENGILVGSKTKIFRGSKFSRIRLVRGPWEDELNDGKYERVIKRAHVPTMFLARGYQVSGYVFNYASNYFGARKDEWEEEGYVLDPMLLRTLEKRDVLDFQNMDEGSFTPTVEILRAMGRNTYEDQEHKSLCRGILKQGEIFWAVYAVGPGGALMQAVENLFALDIRPRLKGKMLIPFFVDMDGNQKNRIEKERTKLEDLYDIKTTQYRMRIETPWEFFGMLQKP
jgi:hypothetical protein